MFILLVNPWIYDFAAFDLWVKPLGLLYLSAWLKASGHQVEFIDCLHAYEQDRGFGTHKFRAEQVPKPEVLSMVPRKYKRYGMQEAEFKRKLQDQKKPDLIAVGSSMTYWYPGIEAVISHIRQQWEEVSIVLGGTYASLCTSHAKKYFPGVQVLPGSFQKSLPALLSPFGSGSEFSDIFAFNPDYSVYANNSSIAMITSVGCPYSCTYCASNSLQPRFRQNNVSDVLEEINSYVNTFQAEDIAFYDDALFVNTAGHIKPILRGIIHKQYSTRFHTPNGVHIADIDHELAVLLIAAKVRTLRLSFESAAAERQRDSSFKTSSKQLVQKLDILRSCGFDESNLGVYLLLGLPGQDLQEVRNSADFVHSLGLKVYLAEYSPVPHTVEFERAAKLNPLIIEEPLWHNNSIYPLNARGYDFEEIFEFKTWVKEQNKLVNK